MALNSIADRLTPSVPIELTYSAQPIAAGTKYTTLFAHKAASGATAPDYDLYTVTNVGDPVAAQEEVDAIAGKDSEAGKLAYSFVASNALAGRSNFPAFRIVLLPNGEANFGPNDEGLAIVKTIRSDMIVSCYPASDSNLSKLIDLATLMSGPDRDLNGQFGTTVVAATIAEQSAATQIKPNSRFAIIPWLQDTNAAEIVVNGIAATGTGNLTGITGSMVGLAVGQVLTGTDLDGGSAHITSLDVANKALTVDGTFHTDGGVTVRAEGAPANTEGQVAVAVAAGLMSLGQPYVPAQGLAIGGLAAPVKRADWMMVDPQGASEQGLAAGLSPLTIQPGGVVGFLRTRLTLTLKPDGVTTVTDYVDWQQVQKLYDYKEALYQVSQNPPFNNNPGGAMASVEIAAKFGDEMLRVASDFEKAGMFQNVKLLSKYFVCQPSKTSRGRMDFRVPVDAVPGLYVIAGNIVAVSDAVNFTI